MGGSREVDYVVVGAGSAGAIVAARLSADGDATVLLIEAGRRDLNPILHIPAAARWAFNARRYNWNYQSEPEPHLNGRRLSQPRGRVLGGSSSINGLVYLRGHALDYEAWAEAGADGWSYREVLPYFQRLERGAHAQNPYQGADGPVGVSTVRRLNPISRAFMQACDEAGYDFTEDVNGYRQEGYGLFPMNIAGGLRQSTARAYLHPAARRSNLSVETRAHADRIVFDGRRAVALDYRHRGRPRRVHIRREIILSAGAFNTPKLLMLSGVGPADSLRRRGITVLHDLPGVGMNLMDHPLSAIQAACKQPVSLYRHLNLPCQARATLRWLFKRDGLLASNHFECGAFIRSAAGVRFPDLQLYLFPVAVAEGSKDFMRGHGFQVQVSTQRSASRGWVKLASSDPDTPPRICFRFLDNEADFTELRAGFGLAREILAQPAMRDFHDHEMLPGPAVRSDREMDAWLRAHLQSSYHPAGTCKMGRDSMSVVDPACRVHGLEGLRVADASIMPVITSCNLNGPAMMIGEKAADLTAERNPLPPSDLPFFTDPHWRTRQRQRPAAAD